MMKQLKRTFAKAAAIIEHKWDIYQFDVADDEAARAQLDAAAAGVEHARRHGEGGDSATDISKLLPSCQSNSKYVKPYTEHMLYHAWLRSSYVSYDAFHEET